uniref:Uncharacterized protein n=1 Tax=Arundo donax TaxID=35708 RepID=A0A0A8ZCX3_ARUDO
MEEDGVGYLEFRGGSTELATE